jgi:hypothetical protein
VRPPISKDFTEPWPTGVLVALCSAFPVGFLSLRTTAEIMIGATLREAVISNISHAMLGQRHQSKVYQTPTIPESMC